MSTRIQEDFSYRPGPIPDREVVSIFRRFLAEKRLRVTRERLAVVEEVFSSHRHFDVEDLYQRLVAHARAVSRATLYRTLDLLVESGLVARARFATDTFQYEPRYGLEHHDHMVCQQCGRVVEFVSEEIERLQGDACAAHDFTPTSHRLVIVGTCRDCRTAKADGTT